MNLLRRVVFSAALAGVLAGLLLYAVQAVFVVPLILQAESYENAEPVQQAQPADDGHNHSHAAGDDQAASGLDRRSLLTAAADALTGVGFGLLLVAGFALRGGVDWRRGLAWGVAGFMAFNLAPALGLPPELPGDFAAPLADRQFWWLFAAVATAGGLALAAFAQSWPWRAAGLVLIALPHVIGAPSPEEHGGLAPDDLRWSFQIAALATMALFWVVLGGLAGFFYRRFESA